MKINKNILAILLLIATIIPCYSTASDSIRINEIERSLTQETSLRKEIQRDLERQATVIESQVSLIESQRLAIDSLRNAIEVNRQNIQTTADELGIKISATDDSLKTKAEASDVKTKTMWAIICILVLTLIAAIVFYLTHLRIKRGNADVVALREKSEKINEDILNQFALEMTEMQKISSSLDTLTKAQESSSSSGQNDHSLIKTLADRITFMEMTLYKMDPKVRGHKQLYRSISQMKDNLLANGYELVEMLGKPYNDGMKVTANFVEDEELEQGQQIITGIIKPQINYKGTMIQSAQITVSQNI